jgi:predicted nucleic acid-binding protein
MEGETSEYISHDLADASAVIKLVLNEADSTAVRVRFDQKGCFYVSSFCLAEALNVLKRKWLRKEIHDQQYFGACYLIMAYVRTNNIRIENRLEEDLKTNSDEAENLARRHSLDIIDALQIATLKHGPLSFFTAESKTTFITADKNLAQAATIEGLKVWYCANGNPPPP